MDIGSDNFYQSDQVNILKVIFKTQYQTRVVGNLVVPKDVTEGVSLPAIAIGHPMGAVKEQSATLYANKLAEQGFATLALELPF